MSIMNSKNGISSQTRARYWTIIKRLSAFYGGRNPNSLNQDEVQRFIDNAALNYAPQSLNFFRAAINKYYSSIDSDIYLRMYTARQDKKLPERILCRMEVENVFSLLNPFYEAIAREIYITPIPPKVVLTKTPSSRGGSVSGRTFGIQCRKVSADWNRGVATPYSLYVSGVIHGLQDGRPWREIQAASGMANSTMKKYIKLATNLPA